MTASPTPTMWQELSKANSRGVGIGLYICTLLLELPATFARFVVVAFVYWILSGFNQLIITLRLFINQVTSNTEAASSVPTGILGFVSSGFAALASTRDLMLFLVCVLPFLLSILTFFLPGGFFLRRLSLSARQMSQREREVVEQLRAAFSDETIAPNVRWPSHIYILDKQSYETFVIGTTLYISRPLIQSPFLSGQVAHALGHVNSLDGRLILALRRLVLLPVYLASQSIGQTAPGIFRIAASVSDSALGYVAGTIAWLFSLFVSFAGGGFGLWLLNFAWAAYWRQREYAADAFAGAIGQSASLIDYLDGRGGVNELAFDIATPYLMIQPPPLELRIDRLQHPENYPLGDSLDLRPVVVGAAAVFLLLCGVPAITSGISRLTGGVEGDWQLAGACGYGGCEPDMGMYLSEGLVLRFRRGTVQSMDTEGGTFDLAVTAAEDIGTYTYVTDRSISLATNTRYFPFAMNGAYEIRRESNMLRLVGSSETIVFLRYEPSPARAAQATTTQTGSESSDFVQTDEITPLIGSWESSELSKRIIFSEDGSYEVQDTTNNQVMVSGRYIVGKRNERQYMQFYVQYPQVYEAESEYIYTNNTFTLILEDSIETYTRSP